VTSGSPTALEYDALHESLVHAGVVLALPELHGGICGALCAGGPDDALRWVEQTFADDGVANIEPLRDVLFEVVNVSFRLLDEGSLAFEPLLPDDDAALEEQVQALAAWCHGFLGGLGETAPDIARRGTRAEPERTADAAERGEDAAPDSAPDIAEILADFAEISRAGLTDEDADTQADFALAELKEYTRMSVQLVFEELGSRRNSRSREVH
jgi:uncharacterized protein YgfB (UPF0149 family)